MLLSQSKVVVVADLFYAHMRMVERELEADSICCVCCTVRECYVRVQERMCALLLVMTACPTCHALLFLSVCWSGCRLCASLCLSVVLTQRVRPAVQ